MSKKEIKQLRVEAEKEGWVITLTRGNHYRWAKGKTVFFTASTPSDYRAIKNIRQHLKQAKLGRRLH